MRCEAVVGGILSCVVGGSLWSVPARAVVCRLATSNLNQIKMYQLVEREGVHGMETARVK